MCLWRNIKIKILLKNIRTFLRNTICPPPPQHTHYKYLTSVSPPPPKYTTSLSIDRIFSCTDHRCNTYPTVKSTCIIGTKVFCVIYNVYIELNITSTFFSKEACSWRSDSTRCYPGKCEQELAANCKCSKGFTGRHCEISKLLDISVDKV